MAHDAVAILALDFSTLSLRSEDWTLHVTLDRPEVKNAMSGEMVAELTTVFRSLSETRDIRCVVLRGAGGTFCAGGDIRDMKALHQMPPSEGDDPVVAANRAFGTMLTTVDHAPQAVVCVVEGAALGGGLGLVCVSDVALADAGCRFGTPEARLGLIPAQIMPFVTRRIGATAARRLAVTGATFKGAEARRLGLVHETFDDAESLEAGLDDTLRQIGRCGPQAVAVSKQILHRVGFVDQEQLLDDAAAIFAETARGSEAGEGTTAFLEKRPPRWS